MARRVEDLALTLPIMAGVDWRDPAIVPAPLGDPARVGLKTLRVAMHTDNGIVAPTREIADTVRAAGAALAAAGVAVTEARPAGIEQTFDIFFGLFGADGGAGIQLLLDMYGTTEASPAIQGLLAAMSGTSLSAAQFAGLIVQWDMFCGSMLAFLESYDVILCPVMAVPAPPHGFTAGPGALLNFTYVQTFNLTGWPAAVVRCGTSPEGLPIGVQIVARPWREDVALAVAAHLEQVMGGWQPAL